MQVKKQQLELDRETQTGPKLRKDYIKAVYCHAAYLNYMQNISCKTPSLMKHKLESRLPGEISIFSDIEMIPLYGRKQRGTKKPLMKVKEESKSWL